jgi:methylated-DNA-[protein]-cysteine S-methyltransferase
MTVFYCDFESRFGRIRLTGDGTALTGLYFSGQKHEPSAARDWVKDAAAAPFPLVREQFGRYERGELPDFDVPLRMDGTAFRRAVWQALRAIPCGSTVSYGELASALGMPKAGAVARNPVGVIVPCHRVIGSDGSLTGYAGGLDRKEALLTLESAK